MDGGVPRGSQPTDRRVVTRSDQPAYRQAEESVPRVPAEDPRTVRRAAQKDRAPKDKKGSSNKVWVVASVILALLIVGFIGWTLWSNAKNAETGIDSSKYQAVYLMNGQIYFGKLTQQGDSHLKLTNVYYLQTAAGDEKSDTTQQANDNAQLIKLSKAIYDPSDEMIISKDQVLYFQNLTSDSRASKLIQNDR